ncbi:MAG TPA: 3-carboxy-cis,cis-muconate cycloisomerase [Myxococcota bacterium]|nr:3-carboxy-cis,cis-muconate cycloisomerase [Myxococcota bacterium]
MSDRGLFAPLFETPALREAFSAGAWLQSLLDFEAALARVQARAGRIPNAAADAIAAHCRAERFDAGALAAAAVADGNPLIPLVRALVAALPREHGGWVHFGATSQDALDTALMLRARRGLEAVCAEVDGVLDACAALAAAHRTTPMAARTLLQQALPTTFGLKAAGWLSALADARARLGELAHTGLALQLAGAAGTLAALEPGGLELAHALARELDLADPLLPWHAARGRVAELACALGVAAGALGKIAVDVALLAQTEVGELREGAGAGRGGSSTLPQKRNPVGAVGALACAKRVPALVATLLAAMTQEHERAAGGWQAEWETLPQIFQLTGAAAARLAGALRGAEVDAARMRANLDATRGAIAAERVALALAPRLGRREAQERVEAACRRALERGTAVREELGADAAIAAELDRARLDALLDPTGYLGAAAELVDRALARFRALKR